MATASFGTIGSTNNYVSLYIEDVTGITTTSKVEAWLRIEATAEHSIEDLLVDPIDVRAGGLETNAFYIYCRMPYGNAYGTYYIDWVWV